MSRHSTGADNYVSYIERYHLVCCGVSSLDVSSARRVKNSPPDCFLNTLSNPVMLQYKNNHSLLAMVIFCGADNYVSYSERYHLVCCGVSSLDVSSARRVKNSPPDCFLNTLSNPVMLQYKNNHSLLAMVIFCGADNYVSYSERYHLVCCGVSSLDVSSARRVKNSPPDCFLNTLSNPVMLQYKNNHSLLAMVIFCGADNYVSYSERYHLA